MVTIQERLLQAMPGKYKRIDELKDALAEYYLVTPDKIKVFDGEVWVDGNITDEVECAHILRWFECSDINPAWGEPYWDDPTQGPWDEVTQ